METLLTLAVMLTLGQPSPGPAQGHSIVVSKPLECTPGRRRRGQRRLQTCAREAKMRVTWDATGTPRTEDLPSTESRGPLPRELVRAWRYCPFEAVARLDAREDLFLTYEDPDVGRCYLYAPYDAKLLDSVMPYDRRGYLADLHPHLRAVMRRVIAAAAGRGDRFRVISGNRKPRKRPSWHAYGLAVDINYAKHTTLKKATAEYLDKGAAWRAWHAIGDDAEALGVFWLGRTVPSEIFHFEYRPGWPGLPRGALRDRLLADRSVGLHAVWKHLRYQRGAGAKRVDLQHLRD